MNNYRYCSWGHCLFDKPPANIGTLISCSARWEFLLDRYCDNENSKENYTRRYTVYYNRFFYPDSLNIYFHWRFFKFLNILVASKQFFLILFNTHRFIPSYTTVCQPSRHPSLLSVALGRYSRVHPVSEQSFCPVGWGWRIHPLHLCSGVRLFNECPAGWSCRIQRLHLCRGVKHPN